MADKKPEQPVQSMADAEGIGFVVESGNVAELYAAESALDERIMALCDKVLAEILVFFRFCAEYGREGQETLIGIVIEELFFHAGMRGKVHQLVIAVKKQAVFRKTPVLHRVRERTAVASIIIEGVRQKTDGTGI